MHPLPFDWPQPGATPEKVREAGRKQLKNQRAIAAAADKVARKLRSKGYDPRKADKLQREVLESAFADAQVLVSVSGGEQGTYTFSAVVDAMAYPEWDSRSVDGSGYGHISPVKSQDPCGSCVAFAVTSVAEAAVAVAQGAVVNNNDLSELWLYFCNPRNPRTCDAGWHPSEAKEHIRKWGSVAAGMLVYTDFFGIDGKRPYAWDGTSALAGGHMVSIVGYNDTG
ncbi:hypothetical protein GPECTOR_16g673 [Gonium pectorale]|uniref:Peptidase C1A papain C-terminal domain-containing protein n=1 Tax=Gonium pectorale TaxID=33097 RepID=A0A150GL40_GONPE|nr:hypothetical protein GPECTOR_16g673 [Gonium pectorale]|eukprot:KXZ50498.1 hypothetical protein GPECTOR_16g673 [Gonium pectorale]